VTARARAPAGSPGIWSGHSDVAVVLGAEAAISTAVLAAGGVVLAMGGSAEAAVASFPLAGNVGAVGMLASFLLVPAAVAVSGVRLWFRDWRAIVAVAVATVTFCVVTARVAFWLAVAGGFSVGT
jgi:hypothetical protein